MSTSDLPASSTDLGRPSILEKLTVIVPIAEGDASWRTLLLDLRSLPVAAQILLVGTSPEPDDLEQFLQQTELGCTIEWVSAPRGRARQMNYGASRAAHEFLWFLHADSRLTPQVLPALAVGLGDDPEAVLYFDLEFLPDGPRRTSLNAKGANLRSRFCGLPFGDQGFCMPREMFRRLGGFDEAARYGEDHLLVWNAHRRRIPLRRIPASLQTSARRYAQHGWMRTTLIHIWLTAQQAIPQWLRLVSSRLHVNRSASLDDSVKKVHEARGSLLLIFTKCPDPGSCKSRLIPALGIAGATAIHERLVEHTLAWVGELGQDNKVNVQMHFAGNNVERLRALWTGRPHQVVLRRQVDGDLGERLSAAFTTSFREGHEKVVAVGTDCPGLTAKLVSHAIELLNDAEVVVGPARDGGYYLIALRTPVPVLFQGMPWSQATLLQTTLERAAAAGLKFAQLPTLKDIDQADDLEEMQKA